MTWGGRLAQVSSDAGRVVAYARTPAGDLATVRDVTGAVSTFTTDASGRVTRIDDETGRLVISNTFGTDGRVISQTTASGSTLTYSYNNVLGQTTLSDSATGEVSVFRSASATASFGSRSRMERRARDTSPTA